MNKVMGAAAKPECSPEQQALIAVRRMRAKLEAVERDRTEPIAIIGMGCRLPGGADSPTRLWRLLEGGVDAVTELPQHRREGGGWVDLGDDHWDDPSIRWGAFLQDVSQFDAGFFGISPREAERMDPQQYLLLEVVQEALENAGQVPERLAGAAAGVFVGVSNTDYADLCGLPEPGDVYTTTGAAGSVAAGRISYVFDLQGPSVVVNTACSSSLVAVHLACQSIRNGESTLAIAAGVNVMLSLRSTLFTSKIFALSPEGRCKTFDAQANGFVRGEGCGAVVLKRLSTAIQDGDPIVAVIRGSAVNQDGRSAGLMAPNAAAQRKVIRQALANARVAPDEVAYVETHGTATTLGDPIEFEALRDVYGARDAKGGACVLGAMKTNLGHLEAAAGIAALIKAALTVQRGRIVPNLHLKQVNPRIQLRSTRFVLPKQEMPWPTEGKRIAGVSSFGISGTNAHIIVEEPPRERESDAAEGAAPAAETWQTVPLSARSEEALRALAERYAEWMRKDVTATASLETIAWNMSHRRAHHPHRAALVPSSLQELEAGFRALASGELAQGTSRGVAAAGAPRKLAFVFPGRGQLSWEMGRELLRQQEFEEGLRACDEAIRTHGGFSIVEELKAEEGRSRLDEIEVVQVAWFAVSMALAGLWRAWGVEPDAVVGEGVGEVAAACLAGVLSLDQAARVVCTQSRLMGRTGGDRGTAAAARGVPDELRDVLASKLSGLSPGHGRMPVYSLYRGDATPGEAMGGEYWARCSGPRAELAAVAEKLLGDGHELFVEVSPHPVFVSALESFVGRRGQVVGTLRREHPHRRCMLESLGALYVQGCRVDWSKVHGGGPKRAIGLPTYAWQRERYWAEPRRPTPQTGPLLFGEHREVSSERGTHALDCEPDAIQSASPHDDLAHWLYRIEWVPMSAKDDPSQIVESAAGEWLLLADNSGEAAALRAWLEARGGRVVTVRAGTAYRFDGRDGELDARTAGHYQRLLNEGFEGGRRTCRGVVHLWSLHAELSETATATDLLASQASGSLSALLLAQALAPMPWRDLPRLWLVTRTRLGGNQGAGIDPTHAPLWGLGRCLAHEFPALRCTNVDLRGAVVANRLGQVLLEDGPEDRIALSPDERLAMRLDRGLSNRDGTVLAHPRGDAPFRLEVDRPGILDTLVLRESSRRPPRQGEVEVAIRAASLNFLDVLGAMGIRPDAAPGSISLGGECSGVVSAVGTGVDEFVIGDEVVALGSPAMATHVTTPACLVAKKPSGLSFTEAAAVPLVSMTAWYALVDLARLQPGERVLIHAATGGVGLAAVDIARRMGAEVFATAGRSEKREYLRELGIKRVMDSRTVSFRKEILEETGGAGVDVVLNCLTDRFVQESLLTLAPYGRFVEIGKRDIYQDAKIGLGPFRKNLSYYAVDLARMAVERPSRVGGLLRDVVQKVSRGELGAVPVRTYPISKSVDAFRFMAEAKHIGKICLDCEDPDAHVLPISTTSESAGCRAQGPIPVAEHGAYVISGGLGGVGLKTAEWLVSRGAKHIALLGRRPPSDRAVKAIADLGAAGATVRTYAVDVACEIEVRRVLDDVRARCGEVRGVVHAAAVFDDGAITHSTPEQFDRVYRPKLAGAWNLHLATRQDPLDLFVLCSSAASLFGSPGQAQRAAADAFLDSLAEMRQEMGLCATSINWVPWADASDVPVRASVEGRSNSQGVSGMAPERALEALERILAAGISRAAVLPFSAREWLECHPVFAGNPFFEYLLEVEANGDCRPRSDQFLSSIQSLAPAERTARIETWVREQVGRVLRIDPARIDPQTPLGSLGLDSLMGLELRNRLDSDLALKLPATLLWTYPTARALAKHLAELLGVDPASRSNSQSTGEIAPAESAPQTSADVAGLEESEIALLLTKELEMVAARRGS